MEVANVTYFDLALVGNGGDTGLRWNGDLPNPKAVLRHWGGIDIPVVWKVSVKQFFEFRA